MDLRSGADAKNGVVPFVASVVNAVAFVAAAPVVVVLATAAETGSELLAFAAWVAAAVVAVVVATTSE